MALNFDAGTPLVDLGVLSDLSGASSMTCTTWLRIGDTGGDGAIVLRGADWTSSASWIFWRDALANVSARTNTLSLLLNTNVGLLRAEAANDCLNDTQWHHVAWVFEAGQSDGLRLYVDGVRDVNVTSTVGHSTLVSDSLSTTAGYGPNGHHLTGSLAELAFWDTPLDDDAITQLAAGFAARSLPDAPAHLVAYHDMIAGVNRPGVGPAASVTGTLVPSEHPRQYPAWRTLPYVDYAKLLAPAPYRSQQAELQLATQASGELNLPGVAAGSLTPTGEVNS